MRGILLTLNMYLTTDRSMKEKSLTEPYSASILRMISFRI